jgi:K+ transporter
MSLAALATLFYTGGQTDTLVLMYSINVFLTFSLTQTAMIRYWFRDRAKHPNWYRAILVHVAGFVVCFGILVLNIVEKFTAGGWITMTVTFGLIALCLLIKRHYQKVVTHMRRLDQVLSDIPISGGDNGARVDPRASTAVILVGGYGGLGIHTLFNIVKLFHSQFRNYIFVSIGVIDSVTLTGIDEVDRLRDKTEKSLREYADLTRRLGYAADYRMSIGTEVISEAEKLCRTIAKEFPNSVFFASKLVFEREKWYQRFLHNETATQLQRSLQFDGLTVIVLPVRVIEANLTQPATLIPG